MEATNLLFVAHPEAATAVTAAWQRVLPEEALGSIRSEKTIWRGDVVYILQARAEYIQALLEIIDETLPESRLVRTF